MTAIMTEDIGTTRLKPVPPTESRSVHPMACGLRVALYSHDTMGAGHMRRNLLIAQSLTRSLPEASVLMIAGAQEANLFTEAKGIDCLSLPSLCKDRSGGYHSRRLRLGLSDVVAVRSAAIEAAVSAFQPDVLIVDKVPRGIEDELIPTLGYLQRHTTTRCVLGLREVLDDKQSTLADWGATQTLDVIRKYFDAVWVYGDPRVFNLIREYDIPSDVAARVRFTGYLDQCQRADFTFDAPAWMANLPTEPYVLCCVGGGQDGADLATTFASAAAALDTPTVLLTGPFMPPTARAAIQRQAAATPQLHVLDFVPEADWLIRRASRVIAMGGYNTICSILSFGKPALVVPRTVPRREQMIRAQRLKALGLIEMLDPTELSAQRLRAWMTSEPLGTSNVRGRVNLNGLETIHDLIMDLAPARRAATSLRQDSAHPQSSRLSTDRPPQLPGPTEREGLVP